MIQSSAFKGSLMGVGWGVPRTLRNPEQLFMAPLVKHASGERLGLSPPTHHHAPQCSIVVRQRGPPDILPTHQPYPLICNQCSFAVVAFKSTPLPPNFSRLFFFQKFYVHSKIKRKKERFSKFPCPHARVASPLSSAPTSGTHLLQWKNLH